MADEQPFTVPPNLSKREGQLFTILLAYTSCVALVIEHLEQDSPEMRSTEGHSLRVLLTGAVEQWIREHPEVKPAVLRELWQTHQAVLESVD